uniref:Chemosensory protein n=1 Tax=Anoplophora chinensis TaxID=217632 RepID=A0A2H4ZB73_ANOCN|nr:chemosensory protein [Anoplophora chinensis]
MKLVVLLLFVALCGFAYARPDDKYTTKYDNIDLDEILKNDRLLRAYVDCLLGTKKCTNDGEELKKVLPDAIDNECAKCSEKQKDGARKVIHYVIKNKRDWWTELEAIYDPEGKYRKKYEEQAKKEGIDL